MTVREGNREVMRGLFRSCGLSSTDGLQRNFAIMIYFAQAVTSGEFVMAVAKQEALDLIGKLPDSATLSDIMDELYFKEQVERGLKDVADGRTISHEEMRERMARWRAPLVANGNRRPARHRGVYREGLVSSSSPHGRSHR